MGKKKKHRKGVVACFSLRVACNSKSKSDMKKIKFNVVDTAEWSARKRREQSGPRKVKRNGLRTE